MPRDLKAYLQDILSAGEDIFSYIGDMSVGEYQDTNQTKAAVERKYSIIGEAINQALSHYPELAGKINMDRDIVDFRNRIIHEYFTVNDVLIYSITKRDLPGLLAEIRDLLSEMKP
jgi:uncharacterized protein with HEPN domain